MQHCCLERMNCHILKKRLVHNEWYTEQYVSNISEYSLIQLLSHKCLQYRAFMNIKIKFQDIIKQNYHSLYTKSKLKITFQSITSQNRHYCSYKHPPLCHSIFTSKLIMSETIPSFMLHHFPRFSGTLNKTLKSFYSYKCSWSTHFHILL